MVHSIELKGKYTNIELVLAKIKYSKYNRKIFGNLQILFLIVGEKSDFAKIIAFYKN